MGAIEIETFKHGDSVAIDLPGGLGLQPGERFTIERSGDGFALMPIEDAVEEKQKLVDMVAALHALGPVADGQMGRREPIDIPARPGI